MNAPSLATSYDDWYHPSYKVRVRETAIYLWGSAGIKKDMTFSTPLLLHIRNDVHGEAVSLGTQVASGAKTPLGILQPGESVSIPIQGISGVFATCLPALETNVICLIRDR